MEELEALIAHQPTTAPDFDTDAWKAIALIRDMLEMLVERSRHG